MKVALYCRVSTQGQDLEMQRHDLTEKASKMGWDYIQLFEEKESTRKTRPVKAALLQMCREGKFDVVMVWKLDRWARSMKEIVDNAMELRNNHVRFISLKDGLDLEEETPLGKMQLYILGMFAEFERDIISMRTKEGLKLALNVGKRGKDKGPRKRAGYFGRKKGVCK